MPSIMSLYVKSFKTSPPKYCRAFSSYYFSDIKEQFLLDFAIWIKEAGIKNSNKNGMPVKLRRLRAICNYAYKKDMYGVNMEAFNSLGDDIKLVETTSGAASEKSMEKIANIDRTLFSKREQLHLGMFLFIYYTVAWSMSMSATRHGIWCMKTKSSTNTSSFRKP